MTETEVMEKIEELKVKLMERRIALRVLELEIITLRHEITGESFTSICLDIDHKIRVEYRRLMKAEGREIGFMDLLI